MRAIVLRHSRTGLFYRGYNRWVASEDDAYDFREMRRAVSWIRAVNLSGVELVRHPRQSQRAAASASR